MWKVKKKIKPNLRISKMISSEESGKRTAQDTVLFVGCLGSWYTLEAHVVMQERVGTLLHPSPSCPQHWLNRQVKVRATHSKSWGGGWGVRGGRVCKAVLPSRPSGTAGW